MTQAPAQFLKSNNEKYHMLRVVDKLPTTLGCVKKANINAYYFYLGIDKIAGWKLSRPLLILLD